MMQALRSRAGSIIAKVLFGLLAVSFGFWGIYTRSPFSESKSPDTVVATVGNQSIRVEELQQAMQPALQRLQQQFGTTLGPEQLKQLGIADTVLGQLIDRSLLDQETQRLGLAISDAVIRNTIYSNPAFVGPDGKFDREHFQQLLAMNGLTEDSLVERMRRDIPRADLLQAITAGVSAPQPVVDVLYRYRNEKRVADIVAFPASAVTGIAQPSDTDLQKFYDAHKDQFRAPEYRALTVASLSPSDIKPSVAITDDQLRSEYEQRKDEFATPEQREIQQILAPSEDKAKEADAALKAGKDWNDVATTIAGQSPDSIDLGSLSRKEIPHELGDVAFELPLNQPSQPIHTPLGWHILRVVKITPGTTQTFEQAKPKIAEALKLQDAVDHLDKIGNEADDALAGGAKLADVARKFGLKPTTVSAIDDAGHDRDSKAVTLPIGGDELLKVTFATNQGDTSRITDTQDGSIFAVHVDSVTPPAARPLADVKSKVTEAWQAEQKQAAAQKEAEGLAAAVSPATPLAKAAGDEGLTLRAAVSLSRAPQPDQLAPPALVAKLFAAKPGDVVTVSDATGAYTAQLKEIQSPDKVPDEAAAALRGQLGNEQKVDVAGEFSQTLRQRFPVDIKRDVLDRAF
jgi:peptidyl-prolyl cis-trans isomerase D